MKCVRCGKKINEDWAVKKLCLECAKRERGGHSSWTYAGVTGDPSLPPNISKT